MNKNEFHKYRRGFEGEFRRLLAERPAGSLDEQAVPSYAHPNFLMSWLFLQRIRVAINEFEKEPPATPLDFGCGAGVIIPVLMGLKAKVFACDEDLTVAKQLAKQKEWTNIKWIQGGAGLKNLDSDTFDTIICLDVLEHVESLPE